MTPGGEAEAARFSRRLVKADQDLGSVIVDGAALLPAGSFTLVAGGRVFKASTAEVGCQCAEGAPGHRHRVLVADGLAGAIDIRTGNLIVLRNDDGLIVVEETSYATR